MRKARTSAKPVRLSATSNLHVLSSMPGKEKERPGQKDEGRAKKVDREKVGKAGTSGTVSHCLTLVSVTFATRIGTCSAAVTSTRATSQPYRSLRSVFASTTHASSALCPPVSLHFPIKTISCPGGITHSEHRFPVPSSKLCQI